MKPISRRPAFDLLDWRTAHIVDRLHIAMADQYEMVILGHGNSTTDDQRVE
jgi:hypothetical protein